MRTFYFVGGPRDGHEEEFFGRLKEIGGAPSGWQIYPHLADTRALHIVIAESENEIVEHLANFDGIYQRGEIIEVRSTK